MTASPVAGRPAALVLLLGLLACGGEGPPPPARQPSAIAVVAGDNQQGTAGSQLADPIVFRVTDRQGPLPGISVAFALADPAGTLSASSAVTAADGQVSVRWGLAGSLGVQTLSGTVSGVPPATAQATVTAGPAALVAPITTANQFVVVGRAVPVPPAVRVTDAFGNPVAGQAVSFFDPTGRSRVVGAETISNQAGVAGVGSWTVANQAGSFSLIASIGEGRTATFVAFAIPAVVQAAGGDNQEVNAGTEVPVPPAVLALDDAGQPLVDVVVTYAVTLGGGRVLGNAVARTGADGIARAAGWILGPDPGPNQLKADIPGTPGVSFGATGRAAVPSAAVAIGPPPTSGMVRNFVTPTPALRVSDATGQPVAGVPVTFAVVGGGGTLSRWSPTTDYRGEARLGAWRLGPTAGPQAVSGSVAGLPPVVFPVASVPPPPGAFTIDLRFIGPEPTASQRAAFEAAAARWARLILGDLEPIPFDGSEDMSFCGGQPLTETIDDVVIFATIQRIDGPGNILGQAGPCYVRDADLLTVVGRMIFDLDDVATLENSGRFVDVVLHEMGHVLGFGSLWNLMGLITGRGGGDPFFHGPAARAAFIAADPLASFGGTIVPVENSGGPGTRDVHWRESVARNELMTGFLNAGTANPLSAFTAGSLRDQGYLVDDAAADEFSLLAALRGIGTPPIALVEAPWTAPVRTKDRSGAVRRIFFAAPGSARP